MSEIAGDFKVGARYSNEEIYRSLSVGNAGGVRAKLDSSGNVKRLVVMTSVPSARQVSENPYHDRLEGDILIYTGAGRSGNQSVTGANARIIEQLTQPFPIYGFMLIGSRRDRSFGEKRWAFIGLLECSRFFQERQMDAKGNWRDAWVFELRVHAAPPVVEHARDREIMAELLTRSRSYAPGSEDSEVVSSPVQLSSDVADFASLEAVRKDLLGVDPRHFERVIKQLLVCSGFEEVEVTRYSQDGGIDLNAIPGRQCWPIRQVRLQVQAKRWMHTVGRREVAELRGSLQAHAAGCIVTTSHFSRAALKEAVETGKVPIGLVDGYQLASIVESNNAKVAELGKAGGNRSKAS